MLFSVHNIRMIYRMAYASCLNPSLWTRPPPSLLCDSFGSTMRTAMIDLRRAQIRLRRSHRLIPVKVTRGEMCWNLKHLKEKHKWKATALYHKWMTRACFTSEWLTEASITSEYDHSEDEGWMTLTKRTSLLDVQWIWNEHGIYDVWFRLFLNQTSQITCDDESHSRRGRNQIRRQGVGLENIRHKRINLEKENQAQCENSRHIAVVQTQSFHGLFKVFHHDAELVKTTYVCP